MLEQLSYYTFLVMIISFPIIHIISRIIFFKKNNQPIWYAFIPYYGNYKVHESLEIEGLFYLKEIPLAIFYIYAIYLLVCSYFSTTDGQGAIWVLSFATIFFAAPYSILMQIVYIITMLFKKNISLLLKIGLFFCNFALIVEIYFLSIWLGTF